MSPSRRGKHRADRAHLTLARIPGDPRALLDRYFESAATMAGVGRDHGLILHAAASTGDGLLMLNFWRSQAGSQAAAGDPRRLGELRRHGLDPGSIRREHLDVAHWYLGDGTRPSAAG